VATAAEAPTTATAAVTSQPKPYSTGNPVATLLEGKKTTYRVD